MNPTPESTPMSPEDTPTSSSKKKETQTKPSGYQGIDFDEITTDGILGVLDRMNREQPKNSQSHKKNQHTKPPAT